MIRTPTTISGVKASLFNTVPTYIFRQYGTNTMWVGKEFHSMEHIISCTLKCNFVIGSVFP